MTGLRRGTGGTARPRIAASGFRRRRGSAGFTLLEAMAAVALMGIILTALGAVTAQWLPSWNRGFVRVQRGELFSVALDRLAADLSSAEFVTANRNAKAPLFEGTPTGLVLVRTAIGPNTERGLEIVRIAEATDRQGIALVRSRTPFRPFGSGEVLAGDLPFVDPVVLLRAPFRVSFAYSNGDGTWQDTWRQQEQLPVTVRFLVRDTTNGRTLAISSAAMVHVNMQAACGNGTSGGAAPGADPQQQQQQQGAATPLAAAGTQPQQGLQGAAAGAVTPAPGGGGCGGGTAAPGPAVAPANGSR